MGSFVWINGRIFPKSKAKVSVFDSSYLYGEGVFETIRVREGRILFAGEHWARLRRSARSLGLKLPFSSKVLEKAIGLLLKKNSLREAGVRLTLSHLPTGKSQLVIFTRSCPKYPSTGRLILIRSVTGAGGVLPTVKTTNRLANVLAEQEIKKRNATEGVFRNRDGFVTEGSTSNLFIVKRRKVWTPPLSDGLLPGTRRAVVMRLARKLGIVVKERSLHPKDLAASDEIFVTSTLKEILPIAFFEGKKIGRSVPGPVTTRLMAAYEQLLPFSRRTCYSYHRV